MRQSLKQRHITMIALGGVIVRVMVCYVGSVSILILCMPWTDKANQKSPQVSLSNIAGFTGAAVAMKTVLFESFISVMNSFLARMR